MKKIILSEITPNELTEIIDTAVKKALPTEKPRKRTRKETAVILRVSLPTVDKFIKTGELDAERLPNGRIRISDEAIQAALKTVKVLIRRNGGYEYEV